MSRTTVELNVVVSVYTKKYEVPETLFKQFTQDHADRTAQRAADRARELLESRMGDFESTVYRLLDQEWDNTLMELQVSRAAANGAFIDVEVLESEDVLTPLETQQLIAERRLHG